nr:hypothetical protein GCM10025730_05460 [Promicromonospora thailandica]
MACAAWPGTSPGRLTSPSWSIGHAPARNTGREPAGTVAAYAYGRDRDTRTSAVERLRRRSAYDPQVPGSPDVALDWRTDHLLGAPFQEAPLGPATLVRYPHPPDAPAPRVAVVHVHGYNDYFFQEHLARAFAAAGYAFYAVDLRAAGRSLRPGQLPHFVMDLREQATDIAAASRTVRGLEPGLPLVVHAHSTGGLTAALWAHAHRNAAGADAGPDLLVLDSPFLDLRAPQWKRTVGTRFLDTVGHLAATAIVNDGPSRYAEHLLAANGGRWQFDTTLKRPEECPAGSAGSSPCAAGRRASPRAWRSRARCCWPGPTRRGPTRSTTRCSTRRTRCSTSSRWPPSSPASALTSPSWSCPAACTTSRSRHAVRAKPTCTACSNGRTAD